VHRLSAFEDKIRSQVNTLIDPIIEPIGFGFFASLERFATSLGFVFQKVPGKHFDENPEDYTVEHSASLAVLDPQGRLAGLVRPPFNAPAIARDLQKLTEKTAP